MKKFPIFQCFLRNRLIFKGLFYLFSQDREGILWRFFIQHPLSYIYRLFSLFFCKDAKISQSGYFFHGVEDCTALKEELLSDKTFLFLGFGYCLRPQTCPSQRFSHTCRENSAHLACNECLIGSCLRQDLPFFSCSIIPTAFSLTKKLMQIKKDHPEKKILFIIAACPYSIELFSPWAKFLQLQGLSLALSGPICSSFSTFRESERGKKSLATQLLPHQKKELFTLLAVRKKAFLT